MENIWTSFDSLKRAKIYFPVWAAGKLEIPSIRWKLFGILFWHDLIYFFIIFQEGFSLSSFDIEGRRKKVEAIFSLPFWLCELWNGFLCKYQRNRRWAMKEILEGRPNISTEDESEKKRRLFPFHYCSAPFDCYTFSSGDGMVSKDPFYGDVKQKSEIFSRACLWLWNAVA